MKYTVHLNYENIHIFCPQIVGIYGSETCATSDIFVLLYPRENSNTLLTI